MKKNFWYLLTITIVILFLSVAFAAKRIVGDFLTPGGTASDTNFLKMSSDTTGNIAGLTRDAGRIYFDVTLGKLVVDNGATIDEVGGGVTLPGSSTDNAIVRWDGAGATAIQDTTEVVINDDGKISMTNSAGAGVPQEFLEFLNTVGQNPSIDYQATTNNAGLFFTEAGVEKMRIQTNGNVKATGFETVTGVTMSSDNIERGVNQGKIEFMSMSASIPGVKVKSDTPGTAILAMLEVEANNLGSQGLLVSGIASQSADLVRVEDSADAELFSVQADGTIRSATFATPSNYTAATQESLTSHLSGIDTALGAAGGANTALSNLTATSINQTLIPDGASRNVGHNATSTFGQMWTKFAGLRPDTEGASFIGFQIGNVAMGEVASNQATTASNTTVGLRIRAQDATGLTPEGGLGIVTSDDGDATEDIGILIETGDHGGANATTSADIQLRTGDKTNAGSTGPSGDLLMSSGTNAGSGGRGLAGFDFPRINLLNNSSMYFADDYTPNWWGDVLEGLYCDSGVVSATNGACALFSSDSATAGTSTAEMYVRSGDQTAASATARTGDSWLSTGDVTQSTSTTRTGNIFVQTGDNASNSGSQSGSGNVFIKTGSKASSASDIGRIAIVGPITFVPSSSIVVSADNQVIEVDDSVVLLDSDSTTATDRTIVLQNCAGSSATGPGQRLIIISQGGASDAFELVDDTANNGGGNVRLSSTWTSTGPDQTLNLVCDGTDWIELSRSGN
jgi:hypothetical protein